MEVPYSTRACFARRTRSPEASPARCTADSLAEHLQLLIPASYQPCLQHLQFAVAEIPPRVVHRTAAADPVPGPV